MLRKNSKEGSVSFDDKERSYSITSNGSNGSIETIDLKEKKNLKLKKRRQKENNKRRNSPDIITAKKLLFKFKDSFTNE
jgi:hypothetical protein